VNVFGRSRDTHSRKGLLGFVSGGIFGGSNVGVQVVAYLESPDLDHDTVVGVVAMSTHGVGVVAMSTHGVGVVRVAAAWGLGLSASTAVLGVSAVAALPVLAGVATGRRIRPRISPETRTVVLSVLLGVLGGKLVVDGLTGL
jgi:hypothetical protein